MRTIKHTLTSILSICLVTFCAFKANAQAPTITKTTGYPIGANVSCYGIAYGANKYAAIAYNGDVYTSSDGDNWSKSASLGQSLYQITFGNSLFVVSGANGYIATSTDAITWTQRATGTTNTLNDVQYLQNVFYAVGQNRTILSSTDGITWSAVTVSTGTATDFLFQIVYGGGKFIIIGSAGSNGPITYQSTTGASSSWSTVGGFGVFGNTGLNKIAYLNSQFILITSSTAIFTSSNGTTWSNITSGMTVTNPNSTTAAVGNGNYFNNVYYLSGTYYWVGYSNYNGGAYGAIFTSTNLTALTLQANPINIVANKSYYLNGKHFIAGNEGFATSTNGTTYTFPFGSFNSLAFNGTTYVGVGYPSISGAVFSSTTFNSNTWVNRTLTGQKKLNSVVYDGSKFVAVGDRTVISSTDGNTWSSLATPADEFYCIAYGSSKYVIGGVNGSNNFLKYSTDGITWTTANTDYVNYFKIRYVNGVFFALGIDNNYPASSGIIMSSTDGVSWTNVTPTGLAYTVYCYNDVTWDGTKYHFIGAEGDPSYAFFTLSTATPTTRSSYANKGTINNVPSGVSLGSSYGEGCISYNNGKFVGAVVDNSSYQAYLIYSSNGTSWTSVATNDKSVVYDVLIDNGVFRMVGTGDEKITVSFAPTNTTPTFTNATTTLSVCQNAAATSINSLLQITDTDASQTETFSVTGNPGHGSITAGTTVGSGTNVSPTGWSYTPANGYSGSDVFTIQVSDGNGGTASKTITVTVLPNNTSTLSSGAGTNNQTVCMNSPITNITYNTTGATGIGSATGLPAGVSASWSMNVLTISGTPTASGTFNYSIPLTGGSCTSETVTGTITANALPTATASSNSPICAGTTLNLLGGTQTQISGLVPPANTYAWTGVNSFSSTLQNPSIPSATTSASGTYRVTVTDMNGCTASATTSVIVNALPTATASSNSPICAGTTLNLLGGTLTQIPGLLPPANTYAWTGVNSFSSTLQNPSIPSATTSASGTYRVTVTDMNGCTASATTSVIVNALPTATASSNSPICAGTTLNLLGGTQTQIPGLLPPANTYAWTGVNSFSSTLQNPSIPSATTSASGTYRVTVTDMNGCTASATTSVIVNALPTATASSNSPICAGTTLNLLGGTLTQIPGLLPPANTYAWTGVNSFSSTLQNPSIPSATTSASGTYRVTVTDMNGCTASATTSVIVNALPTATASSNSPICAGTTLNLLGGTQTQIPGLLPPANTYAWTGVNSFSSTLQNPSIPSATTSASGTYRVTVTDMNGCTASATTSVIVNALPTATASSNSPICAGTTLNLLGGTQTQIPGLLPPANTYAWTGVNSFSSTLQNPSIPSATTSASGTYRVTVTDMNGCTASATTSVIVNALPTATASSNSPICAGTTLNLLGGTQTQIPGLLPPANTYAWTGVNSFSSTLQNPSIPSATTSASGTYRVTVTDMNGCTASATTSVIVNALPTATASSNSPICAGTTLNLLGGTLTQIPGLLPPANTYAWTGVNSFSSTLQNPSIPSATTSASGTYRVTVTDMNGCTASATTSVIVNALPTATASSNSPICAGTTLNLLGGTQTQIPGLLPPANTYAWTGVNSFSSTLQNPSIPSATTSASGTYRVTVTDMNGCTASATTSVIVNALPTATASSNSPICAGTTLNLLGGTQTQIPGLLPPANTYAWTGVNSFSSTLQNPSIPSATTSASGTYRVTVTDMNGCTASATTSVIVNALPTATASSNSPICAGTTLNLLGGTQGQTASALPTETYAWTGVNSFSSTLQNPSILSATTSASGTYRVTVTDMNGCTASATTSVIVNALPTATASSNSPICAGTTLNLLGGTQTQIPGLVPPANTYAWTGVNSFSSTLQNPSIPSATTSASGTYRVTVTDMNGCTASATTSVIVNALPTATASSNSPICAGTTLNLLGGTQTQISGLVPPANTYAWTGVNSFSSTLQNPSIPSATTSASGTYRVTVTDMNGCTASATTSVIVNALPTATASSNSPICAGTTLNLLGGTQTQIPGLLPPANTYAWTGVNSFSSTLQNPSIPSATTSASGTYRVTVTDMNGCTASATTSVIVNALPTATASSNSPICAGTTLNLLGGTLTQIPGLLPPANTYAWTGVNSFSSTLQNPSIPSATTSASGTYRVTVTDMNGCTASATTSVIVNALPTATASSNSPICAGTTLNLLGGTQTQIPGLLPPANTYAWTGVNSFSSTLQNPSIPSATTSASGTYRVTVTDMNGCTASATTSVIVNALPTATASSNSPICAGTTLNLLGGTLTQIPGLLPPANTYAWTGVNSFSSTLQNPSIPSATTSASGTYRVTVTDMNGCTASATTSVIVNALPTATASSNSPICAGTTLNLLGGTQITSSIVPPANTYAWTGVNSFSSTLQNPSIPSATTSASGTYRVTVTDMNGCTASATTSVIVNALPATPTTAPDVTIYKGNAITLRATGCTGEGSAIKWYETNTNNSVTMPVTPMVTTKYYAKCEQSLNGITCISGKSNDVTVSVTNRIFVDISKASSPTQNGIAWATAYGDLQTGLAQATVGVQSEATEVWVAKGTYKPTATTDRNISFSIPSDVKIYGGFLGTENDLNTRNFSTNITELSGEIGNLKIKDDNSNHVVSFAGSSVNTYLDGFTVTGGYANFYVERSANLPFTSPPLTTTVERGGGIILTAGATPLIINCTFMNNAATTGGAIYANQSAPHIANCKFMGNQGTFGSAIYLESNSNAQIDNSLFSGNRGIGALYNNYSNPLLTNCTFGGNGGYNGGIFNSNSQPSVGNSIFWGNTTQFNDTQTTITYSIVQGGYAGVGNLNYDPQFVSPTAEGLAPNTTGDYHLKSSSLGIDRGNNGSISLMDYDLDGNLRRFNGGRVDMGAYELQGNSVPGIVISLASGNWESNSTWDVGRVPKIGDLVIINNNHIVSLNGEGNVKNIEYQGTGTLRLNTTNSKLNVGF